MTNSIVLKVKKIYEDAILPAYAINGDAAMDLTCYGFSVDKENIKYYFGIAIEVPLNYVGLIFPRSSIKDKGLMMSNSVGVIDHGFTGEISATFKHFAGSRMYQIGDRVAQLIIMPRPHVSVLEVDELSYSERGVGGYGSTGN